MTLHNLTGLWFGICETVIYSLVGIIMMGLGFLLVKIFTPFSIKKEIEEDQNISLAIIVGAIILGISIIVASVILSPSSLSRSAAQAPPAQTVTQPQTEKQ